MKTLHTQLATQPAVLAEKLFKFERCGRYEEALAEAKEIWEDISKSPKIEQFEPKIAAELMLRCGTLIGFLGHNKQIINSQTRSKDLLSEARQRFLELYNVEKIAECENYLALAYWRAGELNEAKTWLEELLSHELPDFSYASLYSHITKCLILIAENKYSEIVVHLQGLESYFLTYGDPCLCGDFYNNLGIAFNELGNRTEALKCLETARFYHQKSQHKIYLGTIENNLAQMYKLQGNFGQAHKMVDSSTKTFRQIKDRTREGFSLDTKAQIFFSEFKFNEALQAVEKGLKILATSENKAYLVETMLTKVKCLIFSDDFVSATMFLTDAVQIAKTYISENAAKELIKDFELILQAKNSPITKESYAENEENIENLELALPLELSHYEEIQAIRVRNRQLEPVGLRKGSLAIVATVSVMRGDLVAVSEKATDAVSFGFYDNDFGIICLETVESEPQLFAENEIEVLGKIVGICHCEKNSSGSLIVEPLNI